MLRKIRRSIIEFNVFDKVSRDPWRIRRNRIASRLFIVLLTGSLSVIIVYTTVSIDTIRETIQSPSREQYEQLQSIYPDTIQCPCTTISIPHEEFIQIQPTYHQLCESQLVQPIWYNGFYTFNDFYVPNEFQRSAPAHFRTLAMFCQLVNSTITAALRRFSGIAFVNAQIIPRKLFSSQTDALISTFIDSTRNEFLQSLSLLNHIIHANQYVSGLGTNAEPRLLTVNAFEQNQRDRQRIIWFSQFGRDAKNLPCICVLDSTCIPTSSITDFSRSTNGSVSTGCYMVEAVLKSSLLCWFHQTCLEELRSLLTINPALPPPNITALNSTKSTRFLPNTRIRDMIEELLVEQWNPARFYDSFYRKCFPSYCTFTYQKQGSVAYMVASVTGLFGGLNLILRLLSLTLIKLFFSCAKRSHANHGERNEGKNMLIIWKAGFTA